MLKQARLRADCFVLPAQNAAVPWRCLPVQQKMCGVPVAYAVRFLFQTVKKGRPAHRCSAVVQYQRLSRRGRSSPMRIRLFLRRHCRFRIFCKVMHFRVLVKSFCRVVSAL